MAFEGGEVRLAMVLNLWSGCGGTTALEPDLWGGSTCNRI